MRLFLTTVLAALCLSLSGPATAQKAPAKPYKNALTAAERQQVNGLLTRFAKVNRIPGLSVAISVNGRIVHRAGFGIARPGTKADAHTIYPVGQITQQFTAAAIVLLQQRGHGKIKLRQSLKEYFAGVTHWQQATVGHLLTHVSGIPSLKSSIFYRERIYSQIKKARVLAFIKARELEFVPGRNFRFSDANYFLLANVIEIALELFFHDYIRSEFFEILQMKRSNFLGDQPIARRAAGYVGRDLARELNPAMLFGSADATSTAIDLQNWNFGLMRTEMFKAISRRILFASFIKLPGQRASYGSGFFVRKGVRWNEYFTINRLEGFGGINKILHSPRTGADIYVTILTNKAVPKGLDMLSTRIARIAE